MKFWKAIFWILALITARDAVGLLFSGKAEPTDLLSLAIGAFLSIPYYGYAYQVAIGWKLFWQIGFAIVFLVGAYVWVPAGKASIDYMLIKPNIVSFIMFGLGVCIALLMLIPPFKYAFKSNNIWVSHA